VVVLAVSIVDGGISKLLPPPRLHSSLSNRRLARRFARRREATTVVFLQSSSQESCRFWWLTAEKSGSENHGIRMLCFAAKNQKSLTHNPRLRAGMEIDRR
jgi:hypothetical protein